MKPIIKVENLGKKYSIGEKQQFYTLRDSITNIFDFKKNKNLNEEFWALKDVNFEVQQGESIGIVGRNGAGKSTLLKILSQITPPTTGKITMNGRVASLLEVGTGFSQELTGRENIFLNGAILGMRRDEIKRKFDEIVAFAGVDKFLDTSVKRYSSGMYVRLAFAVAAHLESEILIIDEVLAVGDAEFQKKCLGKMDDISKKDGRTVLFVSHNMEVIKKMCIRCMILDKGKKVFEGDTESALIKYSGVQSIGELKVNKGEYNSNRRGSGTISFTNVEILDTKNVKRNNFKIGETIRFKVSYMVYENIVGLYISVAFYSMRTKDFLTSIKYKIKNGEVKKEEEGLVVIEVELASICPGEYGLYFWIGDQRAIHQGVPINYDVVDNMVGPLIIEASNDGEKEMSGYFTLPSRINIL